MHSIDWDDELFYAQCRLAVRLFESMIDAIKKIVEQIIAAFQRVRQIMFDFCESFLPTVKPEPQRPFFREPHYKFPNNYVRNNQFVDVRKRPLRGRRGMNG